MQVDITELIVLIDLYIFYLSLKSVLTSLSFWSINTLIINRELTKKLERDENDIYQTYKQAYFPYQNCPPESARSKLSQLESQNKSAPDCSCWAPSFESEIPCASKQALFDSSAICVDHG